MKTKILLTSLLCIAILTLFGFNQKKQTSKISLDLDTYSLSLNVKDIHKSSAFYAALGFEPVEGMGSIAQKWMIVSNGKTKIGLFQDMFPTNAITFNPKDGRAAYKAISATTIETSFATGFDKESGPCSFSVLDPDANLILIDQH